eukprot:255990-Ditylum_brightwellii.AAC.1
MSGLRIKQIKNALNNIGKTTQVAAAVLVYLEECYGDKVVSFAICECYKKLTYEYKDEMKQKLNKEATISDNQL